MDIESHIYDTSLLKIWKNYMALHQRKWCLKKLKYTHKTFGSGMVELMFRPIRERVACFTCPTEKAQVYTDGCVQLLQQSEQGYIYTHGWAE